MTRASQKLSQWFSLFFWVPFSYLFLISTFCLTSWFLYFWKPEIPAKEWLYMVLRSFLSFSALSLLGFVVRVFECWFRGLWGFDQSGRKSKHATSCWLEVASFSSSVKRVAHRTQSIPVLTHNFCGLFTKKEKEYAYIPMFCVWWGWALDFPSAVRPTSASISWKIGGLFSLYAQRLYGHRLQIEYLETNVQQFHVVTNICCPCLALSPFVLFRSYN